MTFDELLSNDELLTIAIRFVDVQAINPQRSAIGFATHNRIVHTFTGVHWLTDVIGGILLSAGLVVLYDSII